MKNILILIARALLFANRRGNSGFGLQEQSIKSRHGRKHHPQSRTLFCKNQSIPRIEIKKNV